MKSNDLANKNNIREAMQKALKENDSEKFYVAFDEMLMAIGEEIKEDYNAQIEQLRTEKDSDILNARGVRQLTGEEKQYYQKLTEAFKNDDIKQALSNTNLVMPETVIDAVFEDLTTAHPLLSKVNFVSTGGVVKMLMNTNGNQSAVWGTLCAEITKELLSGFKEVDTTLLKLSAFLPVCKATLDLGYEWLDTYIRQVLYEALANGLEAGIIDGTGNNTPIGMNRQVGEGVTVTGGVYPKKAKITVNDLSAETVGKLLSLMAVDANGKNRTVTDVIMVVNPQDYFQKVMPATTLMAPDGTYRNDVLPYPITIVQSAAVTIGEAILGMGGKYFAAAGMGKDGKIEYSDQYQFLEDNRVYLIKLYANGFPMDNSAFLYLDIADLAPAVYKSENVDVTPSSDATLAALSIGSLTLDPTFAAATTSYEASTTNATNTITATPSDAGASIEILVGTTPIANGTAATWASGENTVTVNVTAADGTTTKAYTVTVTKA